MLFGRFLSFGYDNILRNLGIKLKRYNGKKRGEKKKVYIVCETYVKPVPNLNIFIRIVKVTPSITSRTLEGEVIFFALFLL